MCIMIYIIESLSGRKINLKKLKKDHLSRMNETKTAILEILSEEKEKLYSARKL